MKLLVGLGNPGRAYLHNRHNVGFQCLDFFARKHGLAFPQKEGRARLAQGEVAGVPLVLVKPLTFVNESGKAVAPLVQRWHLPLADLLVIYDDMDLPLGKIRLRPEGSAGGHKGMKSLIEALGSEEFPRLRVGIGRPSEGGPAPTVDFVLGDFSPEEKALWREVRGRVSEALLCLLRDGLEQAMNQFN